MSTRGRSRGGRGTADKSNPIEIDDDDDDNKEKEKIVEDADDDSGYNSDLLLAMTM